MRNYIISNVCGNTPAIFTLDVKADVYDTGFDQSQEPKIVALLSNPTRPTETNPRYPSVLYRDGIIAAGHLFGSAAIVNVSQSPLFNTISESFDRYSKPYSLGQSQSLAALGHVIQAQSPWPLTWSSSQSPLDVLQWPQSS